MRQIIENIGGRRFLMSLGAGATSTVLVWFEKITPDVYQWIVLGTVAAYITGNTAQKTMPGRGNSQENFYGPRHPSAFEPPSFGGGSFGDDGFGRGSYAPRERSGRSEGDYGPARGGMGAGAHRTTDAFERGDAPREPSAGRPADRD